MLRAVIDTNIWISALMKSSLTRPVLEAFVKDKFIPVISQELLKELHDTLKEAKVAKLIRPDETKELTALIIEKSHRLKTTLQIKDCRDADDNFLLALLMESKSPLVTLDKDLLVLSQKYNILSPREFLKRLK